MFDRALRLRDAVRTSILQAYPDLRCFVRIAPAGSRWLLISDAPRMVDITSLHQIVETLGLPHVIEGRLLYLDDTDDGYLSAMEAQLSYQIGPYQLDYALPQATAALLLRHPASALNPEQAKPLVREGWRALALGEAQAQQWAADMQGTLAQGLRKEDFSGLFACGMLLAAWLAERDIAIPAETRR